MKCNVGGWDRIIRLVVGVIIIGIGYAYDSYWGLLGLIPITVALTRWCPFYVPFKISTYKEGNCGSSKKSCCCNKK
jgi:hypothetical protein